MRMAFKATRKGHSTARRLTTDSKIDSADSGLRMKGRKEAQKMDEAISKGASLPLAWDVNEVIREFVLWEKWTVGILVEAAFRLAGSIFHCWWKTFGSVKMKEKKPLTRSFEQWINEIDRIDHRLKSHLFIKGKRKKKKKKIRYSRRFSFESWMRTWPRFRISRE